MLAAEDCFCTKDLHPVCGINFETHPNPCMARCAGVPIWYSDTCGGLTCKCMADRSKLNPVTDAVCGDNGVTYPSACLAGCSDRIGSTTPGPCPAGA